MWFFFFFLVSLCTDLKPLSPNRKWDCVKQQSWSKMQIGSRALFFLKGSVSTAFAICFLLSLGSCRLFSKDPPYSPAALSDSLYSRGQRAEARGDFNYSSSFKRFGLLVVVRAWGRVFFFNFWLKCASVLTLAPETHSFLCALNVLDVLLFIPQVLLSCNPKCL